MNYVFKVFVSRFLNAYIDNFEKSEVLLYGGELNLKQVQLKVDVLNHLLQVALLPFELTSAIIGHLKIDIPWSSLNTQPIRTKISQLHLVLRYRQITNYKEMAAQGHKESPSLSIQNEMRKFKEIDEKLIKKYIKRLLLNLSIHLCDTQVTVIIGSFEYGFTLEEFMTECTGNVNSQLQNQPVPDDIYQFFRTFTMRNAASSLLSDANKQQLIHLDLMTGHLEMAKDKIKFNAEFTKLQLTLIQQYLDGIFTIYRAIQQSNQAFKQAVRDNYVQPSWEIFILQDIISIAQSLEFSISLPSCDLQYAQLRLSLEDCTLSFKTVLPFGGNVRTKIFIAVVEMHCHESRIFSLTHVDESGFANWSDQLQCTDASINRRVMLSYEQACTKNERMRKIDYKNKFVLSNMGLRIVMGNKVSTLWQQLKQFNSMVHTISQEQSLDTTSLEQSILTTQPSEKPYIKQNTFKINKCTKFQIQFTQILIKNDEIDEVQFKMILQAQAEVSQIISKSGPVKETKYSCTLNQCEIIDSLNNQLVDMHKFSLISSSSNNQIVLKGSILDVKGIIQLLSSTSHQLELIKQSQNIDEHEISEIHQIPIIRSKQQFEMMNCQFELSRLNIQFGEILFSKRDSKIDYIFKEYLSWNMNSLLLSVDLNLITQSVISRLSFRSSIYLTHPLMVNQQRLVKGLQINLLYNQMDSNQNIINIFNPVCVTVTPLTLNILKFMLMVVTGQDNSMTADTQPYNIRQRSLAIYIKNCTMQYITYNFSNSSNNELGPGDIEPLQPFIMSEQSSQIVISMESKRGKFASKPTQLQFSGHVTITLFNRHDKSQMQLVLKITKIKTSTHPAYLNCLCIYSKAYAVSFAFQEEIKLLNGLYHAPVLPLDVQSSNVLMLLLDRLNSSHKNKQDPDEVERLVFTEMNNWDLSKHDIGILQIDETKNLVVQMANNEENSLEVEYPFRSLNGFSQVKQNQYQTSIFFRHNELESSELEQKFYLEIHIIEGISLMCFSQFLSIRNSLQREMMLELTEKNKSEAEIINIEGVEKNKFIYNLLKSSPYMKQFIFSLRLSFDNTLFSSQGIHFNTFPNYIFDKKLSIINLLDSEDQSKLNIQVILEEKIVNYSKQLVFINPTIIDNQSSFSIILHSSRMQNSITAHQNCILKLPMIFQDEDQLSIRLDQPVESQFIMLRCGQLKKPDLTVLSFNFVKADQDYYNIFLCVLLSAGKQPTEQSTIILKDFVVMSNLLDQPCYLRFLQGAIKPNQTVGLYLPLSTDPIFNNNILQLSPENLSHFLDRFLENRKNLISPQFKLSFDGKQITQHLYLVPFIKEGKQQSLLNDQHTILMIFRNNTLINNQLLFMLSQNIWQAQFKYLIVVNKTQQYLILMKNKSRYNICPHSENCFENNSASEGSKLFISDKQFAQLQLLDHENTQSANLKVSKTYFKNIILIEIEDKNQNILDKQFQIHINHLSLSLLDNQKVILDVELDLNLRFFTLNHLDCFVKTFKITEPRQVRPILVADQELFLIAEFHYLSKLKLFTMTNFCLMLKQLSLEVNQSLLDNMKDFFRLTRLDPMLQILSQQPLMASKLTTISDHIQQIYYLLYNFVVEPFNINVNLNLDLLKLKSELQFPSYKVKQNKFKYSSLSHDIISYYIAFLIESLPKFSLLYSNLRNPFSWLYYGKSSNNRSQGELFAQAERQMPNGYYLQTIGQCGQIAQIQLKKRNFYCATASIQSKIINLVIMRDCLLIISLQAPIRIDLKQIAQLIVCQHSVKLIDENQNVLLSFKASEKKINCFPHLIKELLS